MLENKAFGHIRGFKTLEHFQIVHILNFCKSLNTLSKKSHFDFFLTKLNPFFSGMRINLFFHFRVTLVISSQKLISI